MPELHDARQGWNAYTMLALERLPVPYPVLVVGVGLLAAVEQFLEHVTAPPEYRYPPMEALAQGAVVVILFVYILSHMGLLKRRAVKGLIYLRPAVKIGDPEYMGYVRHMLTANRRVELVLFVVSAVVVLLLFFVRGAELQMRKEGAGLPDSLLLTLFFVSTYVLLGWLLLSLVYTSVRFARGLGALARRPLEVNVFDPGNLLPFGELSLLHSLAAVGLFLIPLLLLGMPTGGGGFIVIGLSLVSLAALFVPLWGVHRQMDAAKDKALDQIHLQLSEAQRQLLDCPTMESDQLGDIANRTSTLISVRDLVLKSPNWPFRSAASLFRAIIAVASPFLIFIIQALLSAYVIPLLTR
jgi:hypothetical protein